MLGPSSPMTDYLDAEVAVVLSVTWAGRTWRLSTSQIVGDDFETIPGLLEVPDVSDEISLEPGGDIGVSVSVAFVLPAVAIADYIAAGYDLADMTAEVAWVWHRAGTALHAWAARDVRADGDLDEPAWGDPIQPAGWIAATIEDSPYRCQRPICRLTWNVSETTWPSAPSWGDRYPLVLGAPDPDADGDGPPAPMVADDGAGNANTLLVSIGWCVAEQVTIVDRDGNTEAFDIYYGLDDLGQRCALVDVSAAAVIDRTSTFTSAWTDGPAMAPIGGYGPVHLAAYVLSLGGADLDQAEWARVAALVRLQAGGYLDDPDSEPWEVARDMLTGLPLTIRRGRNGWAPVVLDPHLARGLTVETWRNDGPWRRVSSWTAVGVNRVDRVEVKSAVSEITVGASSARDAGLPHAWVRHLSRTQEGSVSLNWSWLAALDYRSLEGMARIRAMGWEAAGYQVPAQWGRAPSGEWIDLADDNRRAIVIRRTLAGGVLDYTLARAAGR